MTSTEEPSNDHFLRLFTTTEPALRGFVRSLVPTTTDADDVLQEVAITLWKKYSEFAGDSEEDFRRWAFGVAKFKALSWRRDQGRDRHVFSDDMTNLLADDSESNLGKLAAQRTALKVCLGKLSPEQKSLVEVSYAPGAKIEQIAQSLGRTAMALYKQLHRIRNSLVECTRTEIRKEDW